MIGSLLGGAVGLVGSMIAGNQASKAVKKAGRIQQENINQQLAENEEWYNRNYYADPTQRADAQRVLELTQERIRERNNAAAGAAAVGGGTEESVAATKAANAKAMSDAVSQIAAAGEARKDAIEGQYMRQKSGLNDRLSDVKSGMELNKAAAVTQAGQGVASAASELGNAWDDSIDNVRNSILDILK